MFYEDKASPAVKTAYDRDLQIAQEMNVTHTPSLVIFDNSNHSYGILLANSITADTISEICNGEPLPECPEVKRLVEVRSRHNLAKSREYDSLNETNSSSWRSFLYLPYI